MKISVPRLKKKVNAFLVGEEGKISKQALLSAGALLSGAALGSILSVKNVEAGHTDSTTGSCDCSASNNECHDNVIDNSLSSGVASSSHDHCLESHYNKTTTDPTTPTDDEEDTPAAPSGDNGSDSGSYY